MTEKKLMHEIMLAATQHGARLFRNHVGVAWHGTQVIRATKTAHVIIEAGDLLLRNARPVRSGFGVGSSDLIGWTPRLITQADVGETVAQFLACEVKTPTGEMTPEQTAFLVAVARAHGIPVEARSVDDLIQAINGDLK